jgi:hypothetical protein
MTSRSRALPLLVLTAALAGIIAGVWTFARLTSVG